MDNAVVHAAFMLKRNSIFIKILVPVILVMLVQTLLISIVLFVNGTISALQDNAIETMRKSTETRGITIGNVMNNRSSNLDTLQGEMSEVFGAYTMQNGRFSESDETAILYEISNNLIASLRQTSATGVFMYFVSPEDYQKGQIITNGLYYRDLNPSSTPADYSDILFLRGPGDIGRKDKIQFDSMWKVYLDISPDSGGLWDSYSKPFEAAMKNTNLTPHALSYWTAPHLVNMSSITDSNECITYTRPFYHNGEIAAIIGIEIQIDQLKRYFPATDFTYAGSGGYMLIQYSGDAEDITCKVGAVTGNNIKHMAGETITLLNSDKPNVYTIKEKGAEPAHVTVWPINAYSLTSPFYGEKWALAAVNLDSALFEPARGVTRGIFFSSFIAVGVGVLLLAFIIRISTKPLISIAHQIAVSSPVDRIVVSNSKKTYEVNLLCSTINTMRENRRVIEAALQEERERYLVALENAADTFMEYDIVQDDFMLYYFSNDNKELLSKVIHSFSAQVGKGNICHGDDIRPLLELLRGASSEPLEIRIHTSLFSHISDVEPDGNFYWFLLKISQMRGSDGSVSKIIGTARQITPEKLRENAALEASRHDSTTGFYEHRYGLQLVKRNVASGAQFCMCVMHIRGFSSLEAHYGRVFGAVVLMRFCREILPELNEKDIAVRLGNSEFLFYFSGRDDIKKRISLIAAKLEDLYIGQDPDIRLGISAGAVSGGSDWDSLYKMAYQASQFAAKNEQELVFFSDIGKETEIMTYCIDPVSIILNISKLSGLTFDLFEHSTDIHSVINLLLAELGDSYKLKQIVICAYDSDFGTNQAVYQWSADGVEPCGTNIERVNGISAFELLLDENGSLRFNTESIPNDDIRQLLCVTPEERLDVFCCVMYEGGVQTGRIIFKAKDKQWTEAHELCEISKIISTHLSIEKSNSASRAKSEFLSRISHEIRTPMNAIIGMTGIAKKHVGDPERLNDCLGKIDFSAQHLLALINDVLEMSRIESGKLQIQNGPFSLTDFVAALDILMRPQIEGKEVVFTTELDSEDDIIISDGYRLRQVMVNFLGNAFKFTSAGGNITLSIKGERTQEHGFGMFRFSVKDTGAGISREDQLNVFKAFEQAKRSDKQRDGTGLGLAISSSIVGALGGKIELVSELGAGSEFFFVLRAAIGGESLKDDGGKNTEQTESLAGRRVLLAEDNELNIEIACSILEDAGLLVDVAKDGQQALDKFLGSDIGYYDAILMDIQMPVMNGLTATRTIRKNTERADARTVPIVAMTADAFDEDMKRSIDSGMNGHIAKPVDIEKLYALLNKLLQ